MATGPEWHNELSVEQVHGPVVQARDVHGDITVSAAPPVRSAYLEQVRRIAPEQLHGRGQELAELAAFCTGPEDGPYAWWRARAWAGKSALLSWFVLHPPPGVRVVSFFVTARYAGHSDRRAFTDSLVEQLADLLGQPLPALFTDATREPHLLRLLTEAAERCQGRGERLVLVVDGLDEDSGVTQAPDAYSIAGLLPERPPPGLRVIVSGRPHPPVPDDVSDTHPLRRPGTVRELASSEQAKVVRADMLRELKRLLRGTRIEQDLLGILTAARGGLSRRDLVELTGLPDFEVEECLNTVAGRTFTARASLWQPDSAPEFYVLGHEELQHNAARALGAEPLSEYRERVHAWAAAYRRHGWPEHTPEYLLRGYFRLLSETGDVPRMLACATDAARRDRMLDITGGDTAALAEISSANQAVLTSEPADLAALGRLAVHRAEVERRNHSIPEELPALWVRLGHANRAEALARGISFPRGRAMALARVAEAVALAGDPAHAMSAVQHAEDAARALTQQWEQEVALTHVAGALAASGNVDRAEALALGLEERWRQAEALAAVAESLAAAGDRDAGRVYAQRAEAAASEVADYGTRESALAAAARAFAAAGEFARAEALLRGLPASLSQVESLADSAEWAARAGAQPRAQGLAHRAYEAANGLPPELWWARSALAEAARALAAAGVNERAEELASGSCVRAETSQAEEQDDMAVLDAVQVVAAAAQGSAAAGDYMRGAQFACRAEELARGMTTPFRQATAMTAAADALLCVGDAVRAVAAAAGAAAVIRSGYDPPARVSALRTLARALAETADPARGESVARAISIAPRRAEALGDVAVALAAAGEVKRAEALLRSTTQADVQESTSVALIGLIARAGNFDRAEVLAHGVTEPWKRANALAALVAALCRAGELSRALGIVSGITGLPGQVPRVVTAFARVIAAAGDPGGAIALADTSPYDREEAAVAVAEGIAKGGDPDRAERLIRSLPTPPERVIVLAAHAEFLAASGALNRAVRLAEELDTGVLEGGPDGWKMQAAACTVWAAAGYPDLAQRAVDSAEKEARSGEGTDGLGYPLSDVARRVPPRHARPLLARALGDCDWVPLLNAVARVQPDVVAAIADEYLALHPITGDG